MAHAPLVAGSAQNPSQGVRRNDPSRTLVAASAALHLGLLLVLLLFRNLGWDTRSWLHRMANANGVVAESTYFTTRCHKGGSCQPVYETRVAFTDRTGVSRTFRTHWVVKYDRGAAVMVEYSLGRPSLARIQLTSDDPGWVMSLLTGVAGLGLPLFIGSSVVFFQACAGLLGRGGGLMQPISGLAVVSYITLFVLALVVEATLGIYLYWL